MIKMVSLYNKLDKTNIGQIRNGFGNGSVEAGNKSKKVVALCADLTGSLKVDGFAKKNPKNFFQMGICEQNMIELPDLSISKEVRDSLEEAQRYRNKLNGVKYGRSK